MELFQWDTRNAARSRSWFAAVLSIAMAVIDEGHVRGAMRWVAAVLGGALVFGAGGLAHADDSGVRFVYERGAGADRCPDAEQMRARIAELAGTDRFDEDGGDSVSCVISGDGGRFTAEIELRRAGDTSGKRRVLHSTDRDCADVAESASVVIAMVLARDISPGDSAEKTVAQVSAEKTVVQVDDPEPLVRREPPPPVTIAPPARTIPFAVATAGALFDTSAEVGFTGGVGGGVRRGKYSVALELSLETSDRTPGATEGYVTTDAGSMMLVGCRHRGALSGCGLASLGWIDGRAHDVMSTGGSTTPHFRAGVRVAGEVNLGNHVTCRAYVDVLGSLTRTALYIDDERVWQSPMGSAALGIATALRFP
jgi:hypothetical protein